MTLSGKKHICSAGETFDIIAKQEYLDEKYACELLNANPSLCHITLFTGGEVLELPVVNVPEYANENMVEAEYMPATAPWKE